jgi:hypothetical protein
MVFKVMPRWAPMMLCTALASAVSTDQRCSRTAFSSCPSPIREMEVSAASPVLANAWMRAQYDAPETDCQSAFYALRPKSIDECRRLNPIASSIQASRAPWARRSSLEQAHRWRSCFSARCIQ